MTATIVICGASGDLTSRKLIPALYQLHRKQRLSEPIRIVGMSRTPMSDEDWRNKLAETTRKFAGDSFEQAVWDDFAPAVHYHPGDVQERSDFAGLKKRLEELEAGEDSARIYYLATAPEFFEPAVVGLGDVGLAEEHGPPRRLVVEKPFGTDLASARELNEIVHRIFRERQIYRIDHYLGKETVQNILVLRFANTIFEPIWNRNYIDHVEITAAEEGDVGSRGGYYESAGVLRDMFQNHLMQLLCFTAMEPPSRFDAVAARNEKVKVLEAVRPFSEQDVLEHTFRAQYRGYRGAKHVDPQSNTATFGALRLFVDNWRWQGVPFYLRSGKAMECQSTQIVIQFRQPPHLMFSSANRRELEANRLVIQIQPAEGIELGLQSKVPDAGMRLRPMVLDFRFDRVTRALPEAYERLLMDVLAGDASLFARGDEVELSWSLIDPILRAWDQNQPPLHFYDPGMWGPTECQDWIDRDGRQWMDVCPVLK